MPQDNILQNAIPHLASLWITFRAGFIALGLGLTAWSLFRLASDSRDRGRGGAWLALIVGVLFLNAPTFLDTLSQTIIAQNSIQILSYQPPPSMAQVYVQFAVFLTALVGLIGIGRGLWLLKDSNQGQGLLARGLIHIAGGIVCVNLVDTLRLIAMALGGGLPDAVKAIFG
jgi:hypothetical protein